MQYYFEGKRLLIVVTGSIAIYKTLDLISWLRKWGAEVRVVMTTAAQAFIQPLAFETMSQNEVYLDLFANSTLHIKLAKWPDAILIAPATAHTLAKSALGMAEDLAGNILLATKAPIIFAPAMNQAMWSHPATQENIMRLQGWGWSMIPPQTGLQACGDEGIGNMAAIDEILLSLPMLWQKKYLLGKKVMVTAGGTQEAIDPVRFLGNRSSGKMGYALAIAAFYAGAEVRLISTVDRPLPKCGIERTIVKTAEEMLQACFTHMEGVNIVFGAAAPCDFRVQQYFLQKIKKSQGLNISFCENSDILKNLKTQYPHCCVIGFAAETDNLIVHAKAKLTAKGLDFMMANSVSAITGFDQDQNEGVLLSAHQAVTFSRQSKEALAWKLIEQIFV